MRILVYIFVIVYCHISIAQNTHLTFTENKGQWEEQIAFKADIPGGNLYLENNKLTYLFYNEDDVVKIDKLGHDFIKNPTYQDSLIHLHAFNVEFLNARTPTFKPAKKQKNYDNFFLGNNPKKWATHVSKYQEITYSNIYEGILLKLYSKESFFKYDFVVDAYANPNQIKLKYNGVDNMYIKNDHLYIKTSVNTLIEHKPYVYQVINGKKTEVPCKYALNKNLLSFDFPEGYDTTTKLIIDPILVFASYSGAYQWNWGHTSTYDYAGHLFAGSVCFGVGYPTTTGAFEETFNGGSRDAAISKFSFDGTSLLYSTYLGGNSTDSPHSLVVNSKNELVVLGTTSSNNFPVNVNSYDTSANGSYDIFVAILSQNGDSLLGSSYIGGQSVDGLNQFSPLKYNYADNYRGEVIVDKNDYIYVASTTISDNFPTTPGVIRPNFIYGDHHQNACVFKMDPYANNLEWSTYFGGIMDDAAYSLQFDTDGNIVFTGGTKSWDLPTSSSAINPTLGGEVDGYIAKINDGATSLLACTYIGTDKLDQTYFVQLDSTNNVYVIGQTEGVYPIYPSTVYNNGNSGQFAHKLTPDLSSTVFSTTFGTGDGAIDISLSAFLVNECNYLLISGWGGDVNAQNSIAHSSSTIGLPITPNAFQTTTDGSDYYLMMLGENAEKLIYATYFGGAESPEHVDGGTSRFDKRGIVYQAVCAGCFGHSDLPTTPGAWSSTNNSSNCNLGVFKLDLSKFSVDAELYTDSIMCPGDTSYFQNLSIGGLFYFWDFGDGSSSFDFEPSHVYPNTGSYQVMLTSLDSVSCIFTDSDYVEVYVKGPDVFVTPDTSVCAGDTITLWAQGGSNHFWNPPFDVLDPSNDTTLAIINEPTSFYLDVIHDGCKYDLTVIVDTFPKPNINIGNDIKIKWGEEITLHPETNGIQYWWTPSEGLSCDDCLNPEVNAQETTTYYLMVTDSNGCINTDSVTVYYDGVLYVPNAFTPNGDGVNDIFYAYGKEIVEFNMQIFDRWGELMFETQNLDEGWNGIYRGKLVKTETYIWKIQYKDSQGNPGDLIGTITLIY